MTEWGLPDSRVVQTGKCTHYLLLVYIGPRNSKGFHDDTDEITGDGRMTEDALVPNRSKLLVFAGFDRRLQNVQHSSFF